MSTWWIAYDQCFGNLKRICTIFFLQKVIEGLFKEFQWIKDNEIDKDAILKYTDGKIKDENWKSAMKSSIETCYKDIYAKKDEILKELAGPPFNISKDQCNGLFMSFTTCSQLEGFLVKFLVNLVFCSPEETYFINRTAQKTLGLMKSGAPAPKNGSKNVATLTLCSSFRRDTVTKCSGIVRKKDYKTYFCIKFSIFSCNLKEASKIKLSMWQEMFLKTFFW